MDILSIIGLILAVGMVLFGIMFDSDTTRVVLGNLHAFWDYPSLAITIGGTIGVMMLSFPPSAFKKIGKHMQIDQKLLTQLFLQVFYLCGKCGLGQMQGFGSPYNALFPCNCKKILKYP